ncbi:MAG TPA: hypothetical protein VFF73_37430 [Planctomycetota bacterium]|nr:hypothetical protein [Planctomycetota bacterium]
MRLPWVPIVILGACLLEACVFMGDVLHGTRDRIVFSHKEHLDPKVKGKAAEAKMCNECHFVTPKDPRGEEAAEPLEASCLVCHGEWKKSGDCDKCHTAGKDGALTYAPIDHPKTKFSHARHLERVERLEEHACQFCHPTAWSEGSDTGAVRLDQDREERWHGLCFQCHLMRTEWEHMACAKCHVDLSDRAGPRPLSRFHHNGDWLTMHGDQLIGRPDGIVLCARCHDKGYCTDCHDARDERKVRPELKYPDRPDRVFIHRGDYINRHAMEARENPADCIRCHGVAGFCKTCHEQRGLAEGSRATNKPAQGDRVLVLLQGGASSIIQYHNGNFASFMAPSSPEFHGKTARRDAVLCATCHDYGKETVCIQCHADPAVSNAAFGSTSTKGLPGGDPHPKGFRSSIPKNKPPCSYCHVIGALSK